MTRPKGKLFALLAIFVAIGLVTASGAFTSVSAERTVSVQTTGDASALLGLSPNSTANGAYASNTSDGQLVIDLTSLNPNATTTLGSVFDVQNNGNQEIEVDVTSTNGSVSAFQANSTGSAFTDVTIPEGQSRAVGIQIDTLGMGNSTDFDATLEITANATES